MKRWLPLAIFAVLALVLGIGLGIDPSKVPSPLIGKSMPSFELPQLGNAQSTVSSNDLRGEVFVLNVWGTWCAECRVEHDALLRLARTGEARVVGLNWKDDRDKAKQWLRDLGNPYAVNGFDPDGRAAIDWGVYGAPETFVIDAEGIVRYKHIGAISEERVRTEILPLIRKLKSGA